MITTVNLSYSVSGQTITPVQKIPYLLASNTVKYVKAQFALDENWASCDSVKAVWSGINSRIVTLLDPDGICYVPHELLAKQQKVYVNLTGSDFDGQTLVDRITTYPLYALNVNATAYIDGSETAPITPSQFEQFVEAVKDEVGKIKDIDSVELNADYTLTISFSDGTETTVGPIRGEQGETGNGIASAVLNDDYTLTLTFTDGTSYTTPSIRGEQGEQGEPGEVTLAQLSAVLPTDTASGAIASFPDGSDLFDYLSCIVDIDPVQDLHGYDKPWVGGGGENLLPFGEAFTNGWSNTINGVTATYNNGVMHIEGTHTNSGWSNVVNFSGWQTDPKPLKSGITIRTASTPSYTASLTLQLLDGGTSIGNYGDNSTTPNGDIGVASFYIAVSGLHYFNFDVPMIVTSGPNRPTSYSPYSNICPITGWTGCEVNVRGFNLWDEQWEVVSGHIESVGYISVKPSTTYYWCANGAQPANGFSFYDKNKSLISTVYSFAGNLINTPSNCYFVKFRMGSAYGTTYKNDISINFPSTDTTYHAYNPNSAVYPVSWQTEAGTVYGGTVDLVSGVLFYDEEWKEIDLGDLVWSRSSGASSPSGYVFSTQSLNDIIAKADADGIVGMSDRYGTDISWSYTSQITNGSFMTNNAGTQLFIRDDRYDGMTGAQFQPYVEGVKFYYKLKKSAITPIQLDPVQVACLLGQNNVWANCGDTSVTYKADVQRWVEKMLGQ